MRIPLIVLPRKPEKLGVPCNGCGWCCQQEVCVMGKAMDSTLEAPCPRLRFHDGRFWCGIIEDAAPARAEFLKYQNGMGRGCYAEQQMPERAK